MMLPKSALQFQAVAEKFLVKISDAYSNGDINDLDDCLKQYKKLRNEVEESGVDTAITHSWLSGNTAKFISLGADDPAKLAVILNAFPSSFDKIATTQAHLAPQNALLYLKTSLKNCVNASSLIQPIAHGLAIAKRHDDTKFLLMVLTELLDAMEEHEPQALVADRLNKPFFELLLLRGKMDYMTSSTTSAIIDRVVTYSRNAEAKIDITCNDLINFLERGRQESEEAVDFVLAHVAESDIKQDASRDELVQELFNDYRVLAQSIFERVTLTNQKAQSYVDFDRKYGLKLSEEKIEESIKQFVGANKVGHNSLARALIRYKLDNGHDQGYEKILEAFTRHNSIFALDVNLMIKDVHSTDEALKSCAEAVFEYINKSAPGEKAAILNEIKSHPRADIMLNHVRKSKKSARLMLEIELDV